MAGAGKNNTTPVTPTRRVPASRRSTMAPQHKMPVSGPEQGPQRFQRRAETAAVTGPDRWENGRDRVETPHRTPPLARATARDVHPTGQDCGC